MKDITDALIRSKDQKISLMWQTFSGHKTLFQFQIVELDLKEKKIVLTYNGEKEFIDPKHPIFIKLYFRETLFKGKVIKFEQNKLTLSIPTEIHLREYRDNLRVSFSFDEEFAFVRQLQPIINGANFPTIKISIKDICPKGIGLIISKQNMHLFRIGQLIEILGFSNRMLKVPIMGRVIYALRHMVGGKKLHYKVGIELVSVLPEDVFEEVVKNKRFTFQTTAADLLEAPAFSDEFRQHIITEKERALIQLKNLPVITKYVSFIEDNPQLDPYLIEHIQMMYIVCTYISHCLGWVEGSTIEKFVTAAYLHDAPFFEYPRLARIKNVKDFNRLKVQLSDQEVETYLKAPEILKNIFKNSQLSSDVMEMMTMHKKLSSAEGYPHELTHTNLTPMEALFIVAHNLTDEIISNHEWSIERWLIKVREFYSRGELKKVIDGIVTSKKRIVSRAILNGMG